MSKSNFYACRDNDGKNGQVFENWEECKKYISGKRVQYRGFKLKSEANDYAGLKVSLPLIQLDVTPIKNPNQKATHTIPCISINEYCDKYKFNHFTNEQKSATETTDGSVLLFAVPGSGKTTVIMARTGYLVHGCNVNPKEIVTLTFTKAAAEEMENRYYDIFPNDKGLVNFRTIHSFCWNVILPELSMAGFNCPKDLIGGTNHGTSECNGITQTKIIKRVLRECCKYNNANDEAAQNKIINVITGVKNNISLPEDLGTVKINKIPIKVQAIYEFYQNLLDEYSVIDFDDMLRYSYKGLHEYPNVLFKLQERFKYWSIDEAQDNSELQYELLKMLVGENGNLYMVGDDDQSIYSFRAAKPSLMFEKLGSLPNVKKLHMSTNFRSDKSIVNSAKSLISMNVHRELKEMNYKTASNCGTINIGVNFSNERDEYEYITQEAIKAIKKGESLAVLYRFNTSGLPITAYFHNNNIPYKSSKSITEILSGLVPSQIMTILKCSQNQKNCETIYSSLNSFGIYLDKEKYSKDIIKTTCEENPNNTVLENILMLLDENSFNKGKIQLYNTVLKEIKNQKPSVAMVIIFLKVIILNSESISDRLKYYALLSSAELFNTINEYLSAIKTIKETEHYVSTPQKSGLCEEDESVCTSDKPLIYLSSIHSAKGKQYDRVIIIDCFDEVMPGKPQTDNINYDPEEERRLFYVAITRAKHQLDILTVDKYHGNVEPTSRYVFDLAIICKKLGILTQHEDDNTEKTNSTLFTFAEKRSTEESSAVSVEKKKFSNIFISYSSKERNIADKVKLMLESKGIICWMAPNSISPGSNYTKDIPIAINNSDAVVLILSKSAQESNWVPKEIDRAINKGLMIIPIQIDNEELTEQFAFMLSQSQRIDAHNSLSDAFEKLINRLNH